jgi:hypothetical protein
VGLKEAEWVPFEYSHSSAMRREFRSVHCSVLVLVPFGCSLPIVARYLFQSGDGDIVPMRAKSYKCGGIMSSSRRPVDTTQRIKTQTKPEKVEKPKFFFCFGSLQKRHLPTTPFTGVIVID